MTLSDIIEVFIYFVFVVTVIPCGIAICKKLYDNVTNEEHLEKGKILQRITKTYALVQCIAWPVIDALVLMLIVNKRLSTFLSPTLANSCTIFMRFMYSIITCYLSFNSLVMAGSRYVFVVHEEWASRFGIRKLRKICLFTSFGAPMFIALLNEAMIPIEYTWMLNFMPATNNVLQTVEYVHPLQTNNSTYGMMSSPLFWFASFHLNSTFNDILRVICKILVFLAFSNIVEGLLYIHIYVYYKR